MPKIHSSVAQNMPKSHRKEAQCMPKMLPKVVQHLSRRGPKVAQQWSKIGPEVLPGPQKVFSHPQTTSEVIFKKSRKIEISTVKSIFSTLPW